jgi:hypothetical protein
MGYGKCKALCSNPVLSPFPKKNNSSNKMGFMKQMVKKDVLLWLHYAMLFML